MRAVATGAAPAPRVALPPVTLTEGPPTGAEDVAWDIEDLVDGDGPAGVERHLEAAEALAAEITSAARGRLAEMDVAELERIMGLLGDLHEHVGRAASYASLWFATDTTDPARGALLQRVNERVAAIRAGLVWFDLEWNSLPDDDVERLVSDPRMERYAHHLRSLRRYRDHLLSEPEERILAHKNVTGPAAWVRLFSELTSALRVDLDGGVSLEEALSRLQSPDREVRRTAAAAVTDALADGLRTRAFVYNTLMADKATDDRLRRYPDWISSRNLANEVSDASVQALIDAVVARYDIPHRWYRLKARILGVDRLADHDRMASVATRPTRVPWDEAVRTVRDAYASFSEELARIVDRFLTERWIDAPVRPGKRPGAFCAYTVPGHHPYVLLNYTATESDVLTLAHELGHGVHAYLARPRGPFGQTTPLTMAETASVFGETVTFERMLAATDDPERRLTLLAANIERNIATVFRQVAMNRFEDAVHRHRRERGELSVEDFADHWVRTQADMLGDAVEITEGYRSWWSYIPHFIHTPGYVYAYAFGQLLALSVYARYTAEGPGFVDRYLEMLAAGGSRSPVELARMVDCDLEDPGFWSRGLDIVATQLDRAAAAAGEAGRL